VTVVSCGDVKWSPREDAGLMVSIAKLAKHQCTVYVLVIGDPSKGVPFRLAGWAYGHVLARSPDPGLARVPSYYIAQSALRSPASFETVMASMFRVTRG
jgi:hypothetical protein